MSSEGFMLAHDEQSGFILLRVGSKWGHGVSWLRHHGSEHLWGSWGLMESSWGHHGDLHGATMPLSCGRSEMWGVREGVGDG